MSPFNSGEKRYCGPKVANFSASEEHRMMTSVGTNFLFRPFSRDHLNADFPSVWTS